MITLSHTGEGVEINDRYPGVFELDIAYQASKLLVPSPPIYNIDSTGVPNGILRGVDSENFTVLEGMLSSFSDAPYGKEEELQEIIHQIGFEFRYLQGELMLMARTGAFLEHENKGARRFQTFGAGAKWREYAVDVSFILPYTKRHPLQNTWHFSAGYHF